MTPLLPNLRRLGAALFALSVSSLAFGQEGTTVPLLTETFATDQRTTENLPTTAAWWGSSATVLGTQTVAGALSATIPPSGSVHFLTHFAPSGTPYQLAVGETLRVKFDFRLNNTKSVVNGVRIGLLNSQATRVTADAVGTSSPSYVDDRGYGFFFNPHGSTATNLALYTRTNSALNESLFLSVTNVWTSPVTGPGTMAATNDSTYSFLLSVTRTQFGADVLAQISGGNLATPISITQSHSDPALTFTAFDKLGIALMSGLADVSPRSLTLTNVVIDAYTPPPPPPPPPPAENTLLLDETFLNGERTVENLPTTAAWYGSNSALEQVADGSIRLKFVNTTSQLLLTHFTPSGSPYTLAVGEKITLSFDMNLTKSVYSGSGLRMGLLNSQGSRITNDTTTGSNAAYSTDRGYSLFISTGVTNPTTLENSGAVVLNGRTNNNNALLTTASAFTTYTSAPSTMTMVDNHTYSVSLSVTRTTTGTLVKVKLSGGDMPSDVDISYVHDALDAFISFDKFAFAVLGSSTTGTVEDPAYFTVSNVHIAATTLTDAPTSSELFATWAGNPALTFTGDANADGVADGLAWLLGAATPATNASALLPSVVKTGGAIDVLFSLLTEADRALANLKLQHSTDLATWTTVTVPETSGVSGGITFTLTPDGDVNDVQASIPADIVGTGGRFFIRLVGELAPAE